MIDRLFNGGSIDEVLIPFLSLLKGSDPILLIEYDRRFRVGEVGVTIRLDMIDPQAIIEVYLVALVLVGTMRFDFEDDASRHRRGHL